MAGVSHYAAALPLLSSSFIQVQSFTHSSHLAVVGHHSSSELPAQQATLSHDGGIITVWNKLLTTAPVKPKSSMRVNNKLWIFLSDISFPIWIHSVGSDCLLPSHCLYVNAECKHSKVVCLLAWVVNKEPPPLSYTHTHRHAHTHTHSDTHFHRGFLGDRSWM